jgi:ABC-2 type transport system ATP-binding protein
MPSVVSTDRLTKDFPVGFWHPRPRRALDAVSFEIQAGEVFGLLGPNGAGKSTTLKLLTNLIWPTSGSATVLGRPPGDVAARHRLGFLPENPTFYDHLTAEELLSYFAGLFGYVGAERRTRASRALEAVGIGGDDRSRPLRQYSRGMIQRVGLAQALVNDPELVILDEPMAGLDPLGRREVREIMLRLRDEGRTILFSSHILSDAEWLCHRVAILSHGRLAAVGTVADLLAESAAQTTRGWEVVGSGMSAALVDRLRGRTRRATRLGQERYALELEVGERPEPIVAELVAAGAVLVSVTPLGVNLEDVFVERVGGAGAAPAGSR